MTEHLGHPKTPAWPILVAMPSTAKAKRPARAILANCPSTSPVTATPALSRRSCPSTRPAGVALMTRSCHVRPLHDRTRIQCHLQEMFGAEVSPSLILSVTDGEIDEAKAWQARPLEALYPIVIWTLYTSKLATQGRSEPRLCTWRWTSTWRGRRKSWACGSSKPKGSSLATGGHGAQNRGVANVFIACVDGLKGFPQAIEAVYPQTAMQQFVVHIVRHGLNYVS